MKKSFFLFSILLSSVLFSQELKYEEVVNVDSLTTRDELFNRARSWIGKTYNDERYVIATEDRSTGELSGNGSFLYDTKKLYFGVWTVIGHIDYKVNIFVKDGRYKYIIHSFRHTGTSIDGNSPTNYGLITEGSDVPRPSRGGPNKKAWNDIKEMAKIKAERLINSLKEAMNKKYAATDNW
ncbi:DUF4468 domain-containing protein [Chryseobacterium sp. SN22]|uniref:DUF4468 domain-containing protein n=1 Tax=Chryseobacterium sp. SN22 TaxID=2606431 RepID=UPI0011ED6220|nr:DUF4468 domain-containing protein [Chryseobacterium sp. SN22]KAA0126399.1 DUF4468 domain-containing protein [Chryseobacterium sp. SN22]